MHTLLYIPTTNIHTTSCRIAQIVPFSNSDIFTQSKKHTGQLDRKIEKNCRQMWQKSKKIYTHLQKKKHDRPIAFSKKKYVQKNMQ